MNEKTIFLPKTLVHPVILICILPFVLNNFFGIDFSSIVPAQAGADGVNAVDVMFYKLTGAHHHALLEWTAFSVALVTVVLAFSHYALNHDVTTPVIGLALLASGVMDAFHTLAALRLIDAVSDNNDFIPFTWALSRSFNALVMIAGVFIALAYSGKKGTKGINVILLIGTIFALVSYVIIDIAANSASLPQTMYPDAMITRPFDVLPLILFLFAGGLFYKLHDKTPSFFSAALLLSILPEVVLEVHMAFGSSKLFDNDFNIAHFLKIIAYLVPFFGLVLDYVQTYNKQKHTLALVEETQEKLLLEIEEKSQTQAKLSEYMEGLSMQNIELDAAIATAEEASRLKSSFLANMSHEIRTPLNGVIGLTELLLNTELNEKQYKYASTVYSSADMLLEILNDILDFSKIEAGELQMEIIPYELKMVHEQIHDVFDGKAKQKGLGFEVTIDDTLKEQKMVGDPTRLRQIILNLVGNAIKFTAEGDVRVKFMPDENDDFFRVEVSDTGIGIAPEKASLVFEKFSQEDASTTRMFGGSGLGLAISKQLSEIMGGAIGVTSELGQGSVFWLQLPKTVRVANENVF